MNIKTVLLFLLFPLLLYSQNILQKEYYINNDFVMLSDIVKNTKANDKKILDIKSNRHTLRIYSKELQKILSKAGYKNYAPLHRGYIQFTKRSPINKQEFNSAIKKYYRKQYPTIKISSIEVEPMIYTESLPPSYIIKFEKKQYLSNIGTLYIETPEHKKTFFHYLIRAKVSVYISKHEIKKGVQLNNGNCKKNSIMLEKFRAMPIQSLNADSYQSRHHIRVSKVLTQRDVIQLDLVKRGSMVNVFMNNSNMFISFTAKALQNGQLGSTIEVINSKNKKIKVVITGKNKAKMK